MIAIVIILAIPVLLLFIKMKTRRMKIAILTGYVLSIISFITFIIIAFSTQQEILWALLGASYASIIAFLILWNLKETKMIYVLLAVPALCIPSAAAVLKYDAYTRKIPTVAENLYTSRYEPFMESMGRTNLLAKLDEESSLKITDHLPVLDGATALFPVYAAFVQAVYSEDDYNNYISKDPVVMCSKTGKAYENLLEGAADIIFCAGPSDAQAARFIDRGLNLKMVPIGKDAFVFFVNKNNIINNISINNIHNIYAGKIKNWRELNGPSQRIRAFQRPQDSGSQTMMEKVMGGIPLTKPRRENVPAGMGGIINHVADYRNFPNAIGYSFLFFATKMAHNDQIKLLSVEGVYPSKETIQDNRYPFSDYFYALYIDNDEKNKNIEPFIAWILSRQGQELVHKTGYVPVR